MERAVAQSVEYALRFSSPGHLANKDFPLISKDLWLSRTESNSWGYKRDLFACYIGFVNFTPSTTQQSAGMWDICLIC